jgi:hypothetical protein
MRTRCILAADGPRLRKPLHEEALDPVMAKRARGSVRPGQRRPIDRRPATTTASGTATPTTAPRPSGLTEAEEARAAELEKQLLEQERAAEASRARTKERATREVYSGSSLSVSAQKEYAYVGRDVRQIGQMAVLMLAILFGLWFLFDVVHVISI